MVTLVEGMRCDRRVSILLPIFGFAFSWKLPGSWSAAVAFHIVGSLVWMEKSGRQPSAKSFR